MGDDLVGRGRQVIAAACPQVHQAGDHRQMGVFAEDHQVAPHDVRGSHTPARSVDPYDYRADTGVGRDGVQLFAKLGHRILTEREGPGQVRVQQHTIHIDDRHLGALGIGRAGSQRHFHDRATVADGGSLVDDLVGHAVRRVDGEMTIRFDTKGMAAAGHGPQQQQPRNKPIHDASPPTDVSFDVNGAFLTFYRLSR